MTTTENDIAIRVDNVSKSFKLPHEKHTSVKSALIGLSRGSKGYEKQQVLRGVSFEVKKGDFFAIVGRNGSGKSTLLKMLAGIYTPTEGEITVNGKLTPFIELGVGFNPELTGRENVFLNGALLGFNRSEVNKMYDDIVNFAELERFMDQKLKNYSSGMQVRLAFSIAIRARSDILLLDEVLAVGDAAFQQKCFNYFEELKRRKQTVVFVSHDMAAIKRFCNRAIYINDGDMIIDGTPAEVADMYAVDNMEHIREPEAEDSGPKTVEGYKISTKIISQSSDALVLEISYRSVESDDMYIAFSVLRDGMPIAELTTPLDMKIGGKGTITYTLDLDRFNAGTYEIPVILCKKQNRQLVGISKNKNRFVVKGNDPIRGAALRLESNWK